MIFLYITFSQLRNMEQTSLRGRVSKRWDKMKSIDLHRNMSWGNMILPTTKISHFNLSSKNTDA